MPNVSTAEPVICIVDDDPSVGRSLSRLLRSHGIVPRQYTSGSSLLAGEFLSEADCLIVDVHMPKMSGYQLADRLAVRAPEVPIVFITAQTNEVDRWRTRASSAVALLVKPFSEADLTAAIELALGQQL